MLTELINVVHLLPASKYCDLFLAASAVYCFGRYYVTLNLVTVKNSEKLSVFFNAYFTTIILLLLGSLVCLGLPYLPMLISICEKFPAIEIPFGLILIWLSQILGK